MLKINNHTFEIKFTEINLRQRMYQNESYITIGIITEFYPSIVDDNVISGSIDIKLDTSNIKSLRDLTEKVYEGDVGSVTISINNNGKWEYKSYDKFKIELIKRDKNILSFNLETNECQLKTEGNIIGLYTTSSSSDDLAQHFDLTDFYMKPIYKQIGNNVISKYYLK